MGPWGRATKTKGLSKQVSSPGNAVGGGMGLGGVWGGGVGGGGGGGGGGWGGGGGGGGGVGGGGKVSGENGCNRTFGGGNHLKEVPGWAFGATCVGPRSVLSPIYWVFLLAS